MKSLGRIYLVDDDELILAMLSRTLEKEGYEVRTDTGEKRLIEKIVSWHPDVVLLDINVPGQNGMEVLKILKSDAASDIEVIMLTADDTAETAVKAMKIGAWDYLTKPFNIDEVKIVIGNAIENIKLKKELEYLRKINSSLFENEFLGASKAKKELKEKLERLAEARVSCILITGESGVGKEVIARNIHQMMYGTAASSSIPFIAVNCSALPDTLLESELFGYEKGSFTDARKSKKGLFEVADRRYPAPRRTGRDEAEPAEQTAPRVGRTGSEAYRRGGGDPGRCHGHCHNKPGPVHRGGKGRIPYGSVLPAEFIFLERPRFA